MSVVEVMDTLGELTAAVIADAGYQENACVLSTRVLLGAARQLGLSGVGYPLVVDVRAINDVLVAWMSEHGRVPVSEEETDEVLAAGAYSVAMMQPGHPEHDGRGLAGHLVAIWDAGEPEEPVMVDASAVQFHRPSKGLNVPVVITKTVEREFLRGERSTAVTLDGGGLLLWMAQPYRRDFTHAPDWLAKRERTAELVRLVTRKARAL